MSCKHEPQRKSPDTDSGRSGHFLPTGECSQLGNWHRSQQSSVRVNAREPSSVGGFVLSRSSLIAAVTLCCVITCGLQLQLAVNGALTVSHRGHIHGAFMA
jgi:hypothetical protein